ncbi:MAG: c-type cytochrome [Candidatus Didemnitutus sp.]|nr:c-type cytochrome [Candidatus Didemnitutus sp.]
MKRFSIEGLAIAMIGAALVAAVVVPLRIEAFRRAARDRAASVVELTGVMAQGVWTDEIVVGGNAWRGDFRHARPVLAVGKTTRLRLTSADVVHTFSAPELGIDPVEVYPGKVVELLVTPKMPGLFEYYCTTVCGKAHFAMRGFFEVMGAGLAKKAPPQPGAAYWLTAEPPAAAGTAARGQWLFRQQGCVTCHGEEGAAGVPNPNSMNARVPIISDLARRNFLFTSADAEAFARLLTLHPRLEGVTEAPRVPLFPVVKRQYLATLSLVREGRRSSRLDPAGPRPPLDMPAWGARLADEDLEAILTYLLTQGASPASAERPATGPHILKGD